MKLAKLIGIVTLSLLPIVASYYSDNALKDQVQSLPRAPAFLSNVFSGFLNISEHKHIHYVYVESSNNPSLDPIFFWTNGGPGW